MKRCAKISCWTDYPFVSLGDVEGQRAPIRRVTVVHYDQNKYATVITPAGTMESLKRGYLYRNQARLSDGAVTLARRKLERMISTLPMEVYEGIVISVNGDKLLSDLQATMQDDSTHTIEIRLADVPASELHFVRENARFTLTLNARQRLRPATAQAAPRVIAFKRQDQAHA